MKSSTFALVALLATSLLGHHAASANQLIAGEELYELCSAKFSQLSSCLAADATNADDVDHVCCSLLDSFYKSGCLCPDCPEESRLTSFNNQGAPLLKRLQPLIDTCDEDGQLSVLLLTATWDLSGKSVSSGGAYSEGDIEEEVYEEEDIIEDIITKNDKDDAEDQYDFLADEEDYDDEEDEGAVIAAIDEALAIRNGIVGNEDFPVDVIDLDNDQIMVATAAAMTNPNDNQRTVTHKVSLDLTLDGDVNHLDDMIDAIFDMAAKTGASAANQLVGNNNNNNNVETVRLLKAQLDDQLTRAKDQLKETLQKSATAMGRKAGAGNTGTGSEGMPTTTTTTTTKKTISSGTSDNDNSDSSSTISSSSSVSCNCDDTAIPDIDEHSSLVDHMKRVIAQGKRKLCKFACSNHTIIMWVITIESVILALWAVVYIAATFVPQLQQHQQGGEEKEQFIFSHASVLDDDEEEQLQQPLLASIYKL